MQENINIFIIGLLCGTALLAVGGAIGFFIGRRTGQKQAVDKVQFLELIRGLAAWTSEFSGDVSKYQSQLSTLSEEVGQRGSVRNDKVQELLSQIMRINEQLQSRLNSAEERLEEQTGQISSYLTEARTDGLTGLQNRRAFDQSTDELYAAWNRRHERFTLCLVDIDFFKKINDTYGHQAGDAVLQQLAAELRAEFSDLECIARYGGEEFALLSNKPLETIARRVDEFRGLIASREIAFEDFVIGVSISAGCSEIGAEDKIGNLVRRADEALYSSKLGGRNRVHLHDGTVCKLVTNVALTKTSDTVQTSTASERRDEEEQTDRIQRRLERIVAEESRRIHDR